MFLLLTIQYVYKPHFVSGSQSSYKKSKTLSLKFFKNSLTNLTWPGPQWKCDARNNKIWLNSLENSAGRCHSVSGSMSSRILQIGVFCFISNEVLTNNWLIKNMTSFQGRCYRESFFPPRKYERYKVFFSFYF